MSKKAPATTTKALSHPHVIPSSKYLSPKAIQATIIPIVQKGPHREMFLIDCQKPSTRTKVGRSVSANPGRHAQCERAARGGPATSFDVSDVFEPLIGSAGGKIGVVPVYRLRSRGGTVVEVSILGRFDVLAGVGRATDLQRRGLRLCTARERFGRYGNSPYRQSRTPYDDLPQHHDDLSPETTNEAYTEGTSSPSPVECLAAA
jgi:hypothetical protein